MPASLLSALGVSSIGLTPSAVAQGVTVGLLVSLLFALVPLLEVRHVKPLLLLRVDTTGAARRRDWQSVAASVAVGAALALVAVWQADSVRAGLYVSAGLAAAAGVLYLASRWLVSAATGLGRSRGFVVKHAVVGLSRPGNQTRVILMAVGLGCFFVLGVRAVQTNLLGDLAREVGSNSPDLVLLDVQPDQVARLPSVITPYLRADARIAPLLRGRITAIAGHRVHYDTPDDLRRARQLTREFGLTYRTELEPNERLTAGTFWRTAIEPGAGPAGADTEVSIEQEVHDRSQVDLGDIIQFDIAGQPLRARVTSIRSVEWGESQNGGFVFVLRPGPAVAQVPHTFIGFLQVRDTAEARGAIQRDLVRALPNISVIDVRDVLSSVREVVGNVSLGITAVGAVTLFGGILILVGAVAMTRFQRLYETAIYRTLGASARLVAALIAAEYGVLGALAGLLGAAGALGLSWVLARYLFEIQWQPPTALLLAGTGITTLGVAAVGLAASADVLVTKPLDRLK
jgi:putative ABC transport system permease protein